MIAEQTQNVNDESICRNRSSNTTLKTFEIKKLRTTNRTIAKDLVNRLNSVQVTVETKQIKEVFEQTNYV